MRRSSRPRMLMLFSSVKETEFIRFTSYNGIVFVNRTMTQGTLKISQRGSADGKMLGKVLQRYDRNGFVTVLGRYISAISETDWASEATVLHLEVYHKAMSFISLDENKTFSCKYILHYDLWYRNANNKKKKKKEQSELPVGRLSYFLVNWITGLSSVVDQNLSKRWMPSKATIHITP